MKYLFSFSRFPRAPDSIKRRNPTNNKRNTILLSASYNHARVHRIPSSVIAAHTMPVRALYLGNLNPGAGYRESVRLRFYLDPQKNTMIMYGRAERSDRIVYNILCSSKPTPSAIARVRTRFLYVYIYIHSNRIRTRFFLFLLLVPQGLHYKYFASYYNMMNYCKHFYRNLLKSKIEKIQQSGFS